MYDDDFNDDEPQQECSEEHESTRDANGRWLPGHCPNRKGRPRKKPRTIIDESDLKVFGNTLIDVISNGEKETTIRRSALNCKIFETAMKGSVPAQRFLFEQFEKNEWLLAATRAHYENLMARWYFDADFKDPNHDMPLSVELEILSLRAALNQYYPGQYPPNGVPTFGEEGEEGEVDEDG